MDASFTKTGSRYTLTFERRLSYSPEKVWRVLTERELLRQWFPCDVEGEWTVGSELRFTFLNGEGDGLTEEELRGEVLAVDYPNTLEFRWGKYFYRCELTKDGDGCRFVFSDTFENPSETARDAAGWEYCLKNLDLVLKESAPIAFEVGAWQELFDRYVKEFETVAGPQLGMPES